ncbi:MAG: hypothetical protein R2705_20145 [Ilumatobacteraceae bacterium]
MTGECEDGNRVEALVASTDGFELAEVDLDLRRGTLMSTAQKGRSTKLASLRRDPGPGRAGPPDRRGDHRRRPRPHRSSGPSGRARPAHVGRGRGVPLQELNREAGGELLGGRA